MPKLYPCNVAMWSIRAGDLNGDGLPDLAVGSIITNGISLLFATGPGTFGPLVSISTITPPRTVEIADINADGIADLIAMKFMPSEALILYGDGTGSFPEFQEYAIDYGASQVTIGDLNGDGLPDLAAPDGGYPVNGVWVMMHQ
ncbi:MAG: VCBS repeat-containing protein [Planctomycetes bacterium]|nr:VCBS repeat-containing protein [Planctomycetota bacterium]